MSNLIEGCLATAAQTVHFHRLRKQSPSRRKLLLLHGSGIDGLTTWRPISHYLKSWDEILIPDIRGVGETRPADGIDRFFSGQDVVDDLALLLQSVDWETFDLAGYSYGGMIAQLLMARMSDRVQHMFLLESALLSGRSHDDLKRTRLSLDPLIEELLGPHPEWGVRQFMDAILPTRTRREVNERWLFGRLMKRPHGLACCIHCVNETVKGVDLEALLAVPHRVTLITGARSSEATRQRAAELGSFYPDWDAWSIQGADHGLPVQKPHTIAELMDRLAGPPPV